MKKMRLDLAPCPCCEARAYARYTISPSGYVYCTTCGLSTPVCENIVDARDIWSKRPSPNAQSVMQAIEYGLSNGIITTDGLKRVAHERLISDNPQVTASPEEEGIDPDRQGRVDIDGPLDLADLPGEE